MRWSEKHLLKSVLMKLLVLLLLKMDQDTEKQRLLDVPEQHLVLHHTRKMETQYLQKILLLQQRQ